LGVLGLWVLSGFSPCYSLCTHLLIVNFLRVVSNGGCRLVKPNHLNLGVVCDYFLLSSYYSHLTGLGGNKIYFLTKVVNSFINDLILTRITRCISLLKG
jgi:hypothetical protein